MRFRFKASNIPMIALPYLSAAKISGPDAGQFLHAQFSADIIALEDGESTFACYCTPKGKVIAVLLVNRSGDDYELIASSDLLKEVLERLGMYVLRAKVEITVLSDQLVFGLEGAIEPPESMKRISPAKPDLDYGIGPEAVNTQSDQDIDFWRYCEVEQGVPWLDSWTTDRFLPQMLGAEMIGAVSFSKGCYPGQEIVARTRYLATLKRKPLRLVLDGRPPVRTGDRVCLIQASGESEGVVIEIATARDGGEILFIVGRFDSEQAIDLLTWGRHEFSVLLELQRSATT